MEESILTNTTPSLEASQQWMLTFELVTEESEPDPALTNAVGQEVVRLLRPEGYRTRLPAYTGQKGIESFLVEFITIAQQVRSVVATNHATIAEGIADVRGLVTVFGYLLPLMKRTKEAYSQHKTARHIRSSFTVEIDGKPLVIEAANLTQADAAFFKLAQARSQVPSAVPGHCTPGDANQHDQGARTDACTQAQIEEQDRYPRSVLSVNRPGAVVGTIELHCSGMQSR